MKLLICGLGSIGYRHLEILNTIKDVEVVAFRTGKSTLKKELCPQNIFWDLQEALDNRPDGVLVTNITSLHIPTALEVAKRGIPIFIEKPLSHNLEGVSKLQAICQKKGES